MSRASLALLLLAVVLADAACSSRSTDTPRVRAARPAVLKVGCSASWVPTAQTFKGYGAWRRTGIRIGPIMLMGGRAAAQRNVAAYGSIKFRTLVRPRTKLTIAISARARSAVGFVAPWDALRSYWPAHGAAIMELAPCAEVPPEMQAVPGLADIGYPLFLRVRRNTCVGLTVTQSQGERSSHGTVSIGAGRCRSE